MLWAFSTARKKTSCPPTSLAKSIGHANGLFHRPHRPTPCPVFSLMCVPLLRGKHLLE
jgi:hypothetical protein